MVWYWNTGTAGRSRSIFQELLVAHYHFILWVWIHISVVESPDTVQKISIFRIYKLLSEFVLDEKFFTTFYLACTNSARSCPAGKWTINSFLFALICDALLAISFQRVPFSWHIFYFECDHSVIVIDVSVWKVFLLQLIECFNHLECISYLWLLSDQFQHEVIQLRLCMLECKISLPRCFFLQDWHKAVQISQDSCHIVPIHCAQIIYDNS